METLCRNLQSDENQDRKDRRFGDHEIQVAEIAKHAGTTHKQSGSQCVSGTPTHRLIGGVPDVGRGLNDTATQRGYQRRQTFHADHQPRIVGISNCRRALGTIDAAHHRS